MKREQNISFSSSLSSFRVSFPSLFYTGKMARSRNNVVIGRGKVSDLLLVGAIRDVHMGDVFFSQLVYRFYNSKIIGWLNPSFAFYSIRMLSLSCMFLALAPISKWTWKKRQQKQQQRQQQQHGLMQSHGRGGKKLAAAAESGDTRSLTAQLSEAKALKLGQFASHWCMAFRPKGRRDES